MRHPFHGVVEMAAAPSREQEASPERENAGEAGDCPSSARRGFLFKSAGAFIAACLGLVGSIHDAHARERRRWRRGGRTTPGRGELFYGDNLRPGGVDYGPGRDPGYGNPGYGHGTATTYALGEEGSAPSTPRWPPSRPERPPGGVTTYALGEEGSGAPPSRPTTFALGEEGGQPPPGRVTTYALGEEGAAGPRPGKPPPTYTTQALGEEG